MSKKLCAFRLDFKTADLIKKIAKDEGKTQADVITFSIGLYQNVLLYNTQTNKEKDIQTSIEKGDKNE